MVFNYLANRVDRPQPTVNRKTTQVSLPAYRGDAVNDLEFTQEARRPNPARLVKVYQTSASTLNLVRAFTQGGFADLRLVHEWNKGFVKDSRIGVHQI